MLLELVSLLAFLSGVTQAQETVLGVFILHRHGDRTSKSWTPALLTDLGYKQVYDAGNFYRNRYLTSGSSIYGVNRNIVKQSQLNVQAPLDTVLQTSALAFLQGLYPPVGPTLGTQMLANGSSVQAPLGGYQLVPVNLVSSVGANTENTAWLQGISGCNNAIVSSNNYFFSDDYKNISEKTAAFYQNLLPVINGTFTAATDTYKNAYTSRYHENSLEHILTNHQVYDLIHVATINNVTINSSALLTPEVLYQLQTLADHHEFGLAFNASEPIRAISGSTLAAQIVQHLNSTIVSQSATKFGIQFNAYATFLSFFGLSQLPLVSENFTGIVDYGSSMTFELVTNVTVTPSSYPAPKDISVRFLFSNGSAAYNPLTPYPLFGQSSPVLPWSTFVSEMSKFAIGDTTTWCAACGNTTGVCAPAASTTVSGAPSASSASASSSLASTGGLSSPVAGAIGAVVTLAVVAIMGALLLLAGGFRLVSKKSLAAAEAGKQSIGPLKA